MEIHLKIRDVVGMDEEGRHILYVDNEEMRRAISEKGVWRDLLNDPTIRNNIYMQEKAAREAKSEKRERHRLFEIEKRRKQEMHKASVNYRKQVDYIHDILGWDNEE